MIGTGFEELFNEFMVGEREIYLEKEKKDKGMKTGN